MQVAEGFKGLVNWGQVKFGFSSNGSFVGDSQLSVQGSMRFDLSPIGCPQLDSLEEGIRRGQVEYSAVRRLSLPSAAGQISVRDRTYRLGVLGTGPRVLGTGPINRPVKRHMSGINRRIKARRTTPCYASSRRFQRANPLGTGQIWVQLKWVVRW
jgi:hypothetical protein